MSELSFFFLIVRAQPRSTRTDTLFPYPTRVRSVGGEAIVQKGAERVDPVGGDGQPCRHRMAAARDEQPRLLRGEDRGAEVDAADRAPRSLADAVFVECNDDCRAVELFLEPPRDDADHPGMPARRADDPRSEERRVGKERGSTCRSRRPPYHSNNTPPPPTT